MKKSQIQLGSCFLLVLIVSLLVAQTSSKAENLFSVNSEGDVYLPVIMKLVINLNTVQGFVLNGRTSLPVQDADVCLVDFQLCDQTNGDGEYTLTEVPYGTHTLTVDHPDFPRYSVEFNTSQDYNNPYIIQMMPDLEEGQRRVVLTWIFTPTWGDLPNNMDLHLWLRNHADFHIYEANRMDCENDLEVWPNACYEIDTRFGSGPDSIVFSEVIGDEYSFAVLNYFEGYEGVPPITELEAKVDVFNSLDEIEASFSIEDIGGQSGDLWYVFDLLNGQILEQNCLQQYKFDASPPDPCN